MTHIQNTIWYTNDEKKFINILEKKGGVESLLKYRDSMDGRKSWGHINKKDIELYINRRIREINGQISKQHNIRGF